MLRTRRVADGRVLLRHWGVRQTTGILDSSAGGQPSRHMVPLGKRHVVKAESLTSNDDTASDSTTKSTARPSAGRAPGGPTMDTSVPPTRIGNSPIGLQLSSAGFRSTRRHFGST